MLTFYYWGGGSWLSAGRLLRVAKRHGGVLSDLDDNLGFRLVRRYK